MNMGDVWLPGASENYSKESWEKLERGPWVDKLVGFVNFWSVLGQSLLFRCP